jgi:hypothetical protein
MAGLDDRAAAEEPVAPIPVPELPDPFASRDRQANQRNVKR